VGADIAKRYGVPADVVNIIASHHHEVEQMSAEAAIATHLRQVGEAVATRLGSDLTD
jgi:HD superfamily phosphodiesterase